MATVVQFYPSFYSSGIVSDIFLVTFFFFFIGLVDFFLTNCGMGVSSYTNFGLQSSFNLSGSNGLGGLAWTISGGGRAKGF